MAADSEPSNNQIATADINGRLSSDGLDGAYLQNLTVNTVKGIVNRSDGSLVASGTDPVDYIGYTLNRNVGYVILKASTSTDEGSLLNRAGVYAVTSEYKFAPKGDFSGDSVSLRISTGGDIYNNELNVLFSQLSSIQSQVNNDYSTKARNGVFDNSLRAESRNIDSIRSSFERLYEGTGVNVMSDEGRQIASSLRSSTSGSATSYSSQIKTISTRLGDIASDWHTLHYYRSIGNKPFTEVSGLDFSTNSSVNWLTSSIETGAARTGIIELTGGAVSYSIIRDNGGMDPIHVPNTSIEAHARIPVTNTLQGSDEDNSLIGGSDADIIQGNGGNDRLTAGDGDDQVFGGVGNDIIFGENGNDILKGEDGSDFIGAGAGNDFVSGGDGNDTLFGEDGADFMFGDAGNDRLTGGNGDDNILGGLGDDVLFGEAGDDQLRGEEGNDFVSGGDGNDILFGGDGADLMFGDAGNDRLTAGIGDDNASGGLGDDVLFGEAGNDQLRGEQGNDFLGAGDGNDQLSGGAGVDSLYGEAGNDVLFGNAGNDELVGGAGNDTFNFGRGDGSDLIRDFAAGNSSDDVIAFNGGVFSSFSQVQAASQQVGADVVITYDMTDTITFQNVTLANLNAADFVFA